MIRTLKISDFSNSRWKILINLLLFIGVNYVFFQHLNNYAIRVGSFDSFQNLRVHIDLIIIVAILAILNLTIESSKWFVGMRIFVADMTFKSALSSVLTGISIGFLSPWRIGEYPGRCRFIKKQYWKDSIVVQLLGSFTQNLSNLLAGLVALLIIGDLFLDSKQLLIFLVVITLSIMMFFIAVVGFNNVVRMIPTLLIPKGYELNFDMSMIFKILGLSLLRYSVYLLQYLLIIKSFDISISAHIILSGAALIFLIQSLVFVPPGLSFLTRGEIAIIIWTTLGLSLTKALTATLVLWVINLAIPAFIGMILLTNKKTI